MDGSVWVTQQMASFNLRRKKNLDEAVRLFEELLTAQRKLLGDENRQVAKIWPNWPQR